MQKFLLVLLIISKNIFCSDEFINHTDQVRSKQAQAEQLTPQMQWWHDLLKGKVKPKINFDRIRSKLVPEKGVQQRPENSQEQDASGKSNQVNRADEQSFFKHEDTTESSLEMQTQLMDQKILDLSKQEDAYVEFLNDASVSEIQLISPKVLSQTLTAKSFEQLSQNSLFLLMLTESQVQAINPNFFLNLSETAVLNWLNFSDQNFLKLNEDQQLALLHVVFNKPKVLDSFDPSSIKYFASKFFAKILHPLPEAYDTKKYLEIMHMLLSMPKFLYSLSIAEIRAINPELLSKSLYYRLPEKLNIKFVKALSNEQIIKLHEDHLAWGFHNLATSFKENFTPDALEYIDYKMYETRTLKKFEEFFNKNKEEKK